MGSKNPIEIAIILNQHKVLAVTSTHPYYEAFGIVVLEGLACGCLVVGADGDGIEESLHGYGFLYKNGDENELLQQLKTAISSKQKINAEKWLKSRTMRNVAKEYLILFKQWIKLD